MVKLRGWFDVVVRLERAEPDVQIGNGADGWDSIPLDALTEDL